MSSGKTYLFSIDLEDIRFRMADGLKYQERVPVNTHKYLKWLQKHGFKCTFFTVGDIARAYPDLIKDIVSEGHEIACHSNTHIPLKKLNPDKFKSDLSNNIESLMKAGANNITGFRAPYFSLTEECSWAYKSLKDLGFSYSSSVYPAKNPFYGWEDFGSDIKTMEDTIVEIPMTVKSFGPIKAAFAGGVYFRMLPKFLIYNSFKNHHKTNTPLLGYFHPYDIDTEQEKFMHPEFNDNKFYNWLMNYNRKDVFNRLDYIIKQGFTITTYSDFIKNNIQ